MFLGGWLVLGAFESQSAATHCFLSQHILAFVACFWDVCGSYVCVDSGFIVEGLFSVRKGANMSLVPNKQGVIFF